MTFRGWVAAAATLATLVVLVLGSAAHDTYRIRPGDTLSEIAARMGMSVRSLATANDLDNPDRILAGEVLTVPRRPGGQPNFHVVRSGQSLSAIAARYGISAEDLAAANGVSDPNRLLAGSRLRISDTPPPRIGGRRARHVVQAGESLSEIAVRYGVRVRDLAAANDISNPDRLLAGTSLTIPGGWHCPVRGRVSFVDDFGVAKPDGRFHNGVDLFAARGTPVVAPVAGLVEQITGSRGGKQIWLAGKDGHTYIGSHLQRFAAAGRVPAGTTIGYVGNSGNAEGTDTHLHFEIHAGGQAPINPYRTLAGACR